MNEPKRNGHGLPAGFAEAAMTPATCGPHPCGPTYASAYAPAYAAFAGAAYESEKHMMMCDVCDMLHDIKCIVTDTNSMVKRIHQKCFRDTQRALSETEKK